MHRFLRTIGFSHIDNKSKLDSLIGLIMNEPTTKTTKVLPNNKKYVEFIKYFAFNSGIILRGEYDELGFFHVSHYFPFCLNDQTTLPNDVCVNRRVDTDAYTCMCDDYHLGISLIFYLQNAIDYLNLNIPDNTPHHSLISLSGLSLSGKILLGHSLSKTEERFISNSLSEKQLLIEKAKTGEANAINELTLRDLELYSKINKRIKEEDIYTIVSSCIAPFGSESDNYTILGTITKYKKLTNSCTGEIFYYLHLICNSIELCICIHENDLMGEPAIGRRFKGNIWMQGYTEFK